MSRELKWTIDTGAPLEEGVNARDAAIYLDGRKVYGDQVYDTEQDGTRSAAAAERNIMLMFMHRLHRLLEGCE